MKTHSDTNSSRFVTFVHVEKAGGISINLMLHHYLVGYISPNPKWGKVFGSSDLDIIQKVYPFRIQGVGGHRISANEKYGSNQFIFSFVREPISRFISHLNWQINKMNINHNLNTFLEDDYFRNFQTFRLTGTKNYQEAKSIIKKRYNFLGLMEQYDLSINLLSQMLLGKVGLLNYQKMNTTDDKNKTYSLKELDERQIKKIKESNQIDIDLYKYISEELFPSYLSDEQTPIYQPLGITFPLKTKIKRKISNAYLGKVVQPLFMEKNEYGY